MMIDTQIDHLRQEISLMARKAVSIFDLALQALEKRDQASLEAIKTLDRELDNFEIKMDQECMKLLALGNPFAVDFRFTFSAIKTTRDLERIGDESKTIGKWAVRLTGPLPADVKEMGEKAKKALDLAADCLVTTDISLTDEILALESQIDEIEDRLIESRPDLPVALIVRALERIGDLATNIAENVIYTVKAKDIRHGGYAEKP